ncbi:MAG: cupredoxin family copper-binding protein [Actinobacteria bacterium]|nr:cupredoxin family copper-binding protein [Actinomycetota bacterium]
MKRNNLLMYLMLVGALLIIALPLTGCAGSGSTAATTAAVTTAAGTTASGSGGLAVTIKSNAFDPASLTIKVGDTVTWTNNDSYNHTITSDNGAFDSGNISGGGTFSFTFNTAGTFNYHCSVHTFMTAKIIVQ